MAKKENLISILPISFEVNEGGMFMTMPIGEADHEGAKVRFMMTLGGGCVIVAITKDMKTTNYILRPDALGNAVYEDWKKNHDNA